ncbi:MAG: tetratricopeptide repeat protein [Phycisphaerae bacterium]|nr:tetratricopeptide repeat protein [Phycisphaerae bacterium]
MSFRPSSMQVPPPKDWQQFERNMRDLYEAHWGVTATMHGRIGQPQHGVDIYGQPNGADYHGVQCKGHDGNLGGEVTKTELTNEVEKATRFRPQLAHFILATTAPRDVKIQAVVRRLNDRRSKPFTVDVVFWDDILALYDQHLEVFARHYPFDSPTGSLHQLRPPPADFTGRKQELDELRKGIRTGGVTISGLRGMGGIGKTALALVLADELADDYPDAQFFLDLQGTGNTPLRPEDALAHVIRAYHPTAKLPDDLDSLCGLYHQVLHGQKALLLMDNARDAAQVSPLVPPEGCILLVTSRQHFVLPGLHPVDLDKLPPPDAAALLLKIAPRIAADAARLAELCGRLPLALCLAGGALAARKTLAVDAYVRRLTDTEKRLQALDKYRDQTAEKLGVAASLELSYDLLGEELAALWRALSVFPTTFDTLAAAAVWTLEPEAAGEKLEDIRQFSLIDCDEKMKRFSLHDLARDFAVSGLGTEEHDAARRRHAGHYLQVLRTANQLYLAGGDQFTAGLAVFDLERPNIEAGQTWSAAQAAEDDEAARLCSSYPGVGVHCLALRQHPRHERIPWLEAAVQAARRLEDRKAEGVHLGNLGTAYTDLGEVRRAIEFHEQQLVIVREIGDRRGEGADLGNLGLAHAALGGVRRAIEFHEQALVIDREIGDRRGEGADLGNLGIAYMAVGEVRRAIECHEKALAIDHEIGDRRGEGADLGNLGTAYAALSEVRRAIEFYDQRLVIAREIGDRRGEGNALWNSALAWETLKDRPKAIALAEEALSIFEQIEDPNAAKVRQTVERWQSA